MYCQVLGYLPAEVVPSRPFPGFLGNLLANFPVSNIAGFPGTLLGCLVPLSLPKNLPFQEAGLHKEQMCAIAAAVRGKLPTVTDPPHRGESEYAADQLVTIESQQELDLFSGRLQERTFVKLYVAARASGLLRAMSDRDWKTLCVLATYMDRDGYCYPSQAELAFALGCSRQMANARVNSLARFHFQGKPVLLIDKPSRSDQGRWSGNRYRVLPIASLRIFDDPQEQQALASDQAITQSDTDGADTGRKLTVSNPFDTVAEDELTVSSATGTVQLDTNKNHSKNKKQQHTRAREARGADGRTKPNVVVALLTARGVSQGVATALAKRYSEVQIRRHVAVFDHLQRRKSRLITKNPAGYLRRSIEEDWTAPEEFAKADQAETRRMQHEGLQAQAQVEELRLTVNRLSIAPEDRASQALRSWTKGYQVAHRRPPTAEEEAQRYQLEVRRCGQEAEEFFAAHPDLRRDGAGQQTESSSERVQFKDKKRLKIGRSSRSFATRHLDASTGILGPFTAARKAVSKRG